MIHLLLRRKSINLTRFDYKFYWQKIFDEYASQSDIFEEIKPLAYSAVDGYKMSIFAYGATGSGKVNEVYQIIDQ